MFEELIVTVKLVQFDMFKATGIFSLPDDTLGLF